MKHKLIIKIDKEQKLLEQEALRQGLNALGMEAYHTDNILEHFRWLQSMKTVYQEAQTSRTKKCLVVAQDRYDCSLEAGLQSLNGLTTLKHWTRAGQAMNRVFRQATKEYIRD